MSDAKDEVLQKMDRAAETAKEELRVLLVGLSPDEKAGAEMILSWFKNNFMSTGYKRLGRIIKDAE